MKTVVEKIEALAREPGFIYTLALVLLRDLFFDPAEALNIDWHDHLNFQEITFLIGLLVKSDIDLTIPAEKDSERRFEEIYRLFEELHEKYHEPFIEQLKRRIAGGPKAENPKDDYRGAFGSGPMMTEPIFYGGSGAYDFQYLEFAEEKYAADKEWIRRNVGLEISEMCSVARKLKRLHEDKYNGRAVWSRKEFSTLCASVLSVFCFEEVDLRELEAETVRSFLRAFSLVPGEANGNLQLPGQFNELQSNPIVRLSDGRYFCPIAFSLSEAIYESPFYWMNSDPFYTSDALLHRGRFAENISAKLLGQVFGLGNVYADVKVKKSKSQTVTDIDVLAVVGNKAVIVQVKSKRLTQPARLGDETRLAADFKLAVQEAYDQALLSRQAVLDRSTKLFVGEQEIHLNESIDDAYILCITVDHYPAVMHQLDVYLKKKPSDPFPVALSIFDLDIVAFYLANPFEFAYYLRQRVSLGDYYKAETEMSLLGLHLREKLFKHREADSEVVESKYAQLVDANFPALRGSIPRTTATDKLHHEWKNRDFEALVDQIKSVSDPRFTDVLFFLYDLAGKGADELIDALKTLKQKSATDHLSHDMRVLLSGGTGGMTILCEPSSQLALRQKLVVLSRMAKYKTRADVWLAFGCLATSDRLVDAILFSKEPWKPDYELEQLSRNLRGKMLDPSGKKVGRNQSCPCNSGKKYKYCHGAS